MNEIDDILIDYIIKKREMVTSSIQTATKEITIKDAIDYDMNSNVVIGGDVTTQFIIDYVIG